MRFPQLSASVENGGPREELIERVTMALALKEGSLPTLDVNAQRSASCASCRAALPGPGIHWASGSIAMVGLMIEALERASDTYASELQTASYEAWRHLPDSVALPRSLHWVTTMMILTTLPSSGCWHCPPD